MKTILEAMKSMTVNALDDVSLDLLGVEAGETKDESTGIATQYKRFEVEVPRGYDVLSRCRFPVKVAESKVFLTSEELEANQYSVTFKGLEISFISDKGQVYFRAKEAIVKKGE